MAEPFPVQQAYAGMIQDTSRDQLGISVWNLVDYIPEILGAPLRKRGGWSWGSDAMGAATSTQAAFYAEFSAAAKLCAVAGDNNLYTVNTSTNAVTSIGAAVATRGMFFHRNKLIIPASNGTSAPKSYDGTTLANLDASAPAGKYGCVYKDRVFLGNSNTYPQRVFFSTPGAAGTPPYRNDPVTGDFEDTSQAITGLAALRNSILVYHSGTTEKFTGNPGLNDFQLGGVFDVGCTDNRSIAVYQDQAIWADGKGVYLSDGAAIVDLTAVGGLKNYWATLMASYTSSYIIAGGIYRNHYIVTVWNGTTIVDTLVCNIQKRSWFRVANFKFVHFARVGSLVGEELYACHGALGRLAKISSCWSPAAAVKNDADGTAVLPVIEGGFYRGFQKLHRRFIPSHGIQNWRTLYPNYELTAAAATDAPYLTVSYLTTPTGAYTVLPLTLTKTTELTRKRLPVQVPASTIAFRIAQTVATADTRLYTLEMDYSARDTGRLV